MLTYYARRLRWGNQLGEEFWCVSDREVWRIDVSDGNGSSKFSRSPGESVSRVFSRITSNGEWYKLSLTPGECYPRMARPNSINTLPPGHNPDSSPELREYRARSAGQLHAFIEELDQICRVIQPEKNNLQAWGHSTRNILILACTEVEAHCYHVLIDNGYKSRKKNGRLDTKDYVMLLNAMHLDHYGVNLNYFPWLPTVFPFKGWRADSPTKSLPWYHSYNLVKHDRENNFHEATLRRALQAVTACFVMLCAQYGWAFAHEGSEAERAFFRLRFVPKWKPSEVYVPPFGVGYRARQYPFPT